MPERRTPESGVILLLVVSVIMVVVVLAGVVLTIVNNQSRLTHHQVERIKAYYATKGIMYYAQEMLRVGTWTAGGAAKYACFAAKGCIDSVPNNYPMADDPDIPYKIQVTIYPLNGAFSGTATQLDIKTDYTYTP